MKVGFLEMPEVTDLKTLFFISIRQNGRKKATQSRRPKALGYGGWTEEEM